MPWKEWYACVALAKKLCWHPVLPEFSQPLRQALRPDPPVVCPGFGFSKLSLFYFQTCLASGGFINTKQHRPTDQQPRKNSCLVDKPQMTRRYVPTCPWFVQAWDSSGCCTKARQSTGEHAKTKVFFRLISTPKTTNCPMQVLFLHRCKWSFNGIVLSFPAMPCMKRVYKKRRRSTGQQPGTKSARGLGDKPQINCGSTGDFVLAFGSRTCLA